jgi:hypothetical protein
MAYSFGVSVGVALSGVETGSVETVAATALSPFTASATGACCRA